MNSSDQLENGGGGDNLDGSGEYKAIAEGSHDGNNKSDEGSKLPNSDSHHHGEKTSTRQPGTRNSRIPLATEDSPEFLVRDGGDGRAQV